MTTIPTIDLADGYKMPIIGFGTYKMQNYDVLHKSIDAALKSGYRAIDTASVYKNEEYIAKILKELLPKYNLQRKDIFITSKLAPYEQGKGKALSACLNSVKRLQCDYLDLYLIHWPGTFNHDPSDEQLKEIRKESWLELEEAHKQGKVRSIGISNYIPRHIEELLSYSSVKPVVLQSECHPHLAQVAVRKVCEAHGIHFQAYSSLGTSETGNKVLTDPVVQAVASEANKSPAQVLLRWAVQQNIGIIPMSTNPAHVAQNIDIFSFSLTDQQMSRLSALDKEAHYCWNPNSIV
jgi:diketogulonate reductase-like aldo/keto reductase